MNNVFDSQFIETLRVLCVLRGSYYNFSLLNAHTLRLNRCTSSLQNLSTAELP